MPVGTHTRDGPVQMPPLSVPGTKSFTIVSDPLGGVMLYWNATGPAPLSVAVAVSVMVLPIGCGDACDGFNDSIVTVAKAGADSSASSPIRNDRVLFGIFMIISPLWLTRRTTASCNFKPQPSTHSHLFSLICAQAYPESQNLSINRSSSIAMPVEF